MDKEELVAVRYLVTTESRYEDHLSVVADGNVANVDARTVHSTVVADHLHQVANRGEEMPVVLGIGIWVGGHVEAVQVGSCCYSCSHSYFSGSLSRKSRVKAGGDGEE